MANSTLLRFVHLMLCLMMTATFLTSCGAQRTIVNGLDEREANEILVYLAGKGISAEKVPAVVEGGGGRSGPILYNISVAEERANEAMALLNQAGLPRRRGQSLLNIFSTTGLVPSSLEQKIKEQSGRAEEIASIIRKIDGVLDADVQLSFPEENPLNPNAPKGTVTASVYVKHSGVLDDPNAHLVTRIKRLVASSVPNLNYDNVTVIGDRARFNDTLSGFLGAPEEEKSFVNVWSIIVGTESLTRFRILFFSFTISLLLLLLFLLWLLWKILPILRQTGGIRSLFSLHQLHVEGGAPATAEKAEGEKKEAAAETPASTEEGLAGKGIDET